MAYLFYGADNAPIEIPDRLLAHLRVVITAKLRRRESFLMSWRREDGTGRSSIWLQPAIPLRFEFDDPEPAELDPDLLRRLADATQSNGGLTFTLPATSAADAEGDAFAGGARELSMAGQ